jgi:hypothetical protein
MKKFISVLILGLTGAFLFFGVATADTVLVTGTGVWDDNTQTTPFSMPLADWSFTFNLPSPIASNPTGEATNFFYFLNGSPVNASLSTIMFYDAASLGGFDLNFDDGSIVSLFCDDVGSSFTLQLGTYQAEIMTESAMGSGIVTLSSTVPDPAPVPEPASLFLLGTGIAGVFGLKKKFKRKHLIKQNN